MPTKADAQKWFLTFSSDAAAFGLAEKKGRPWGDGYGRSRGEQPVGCVNSVADGMPRFAGRIDSQHPGHLLADSYLQLKFVSE
jgi:hypothetical protein